MEYKKHYTLLIESRQHLARIKEVNDGLENHHVLPKSLGGTDLSDNLVLLTSREHYMAHWLLYKSLTGRDKAKMAYAFFSMCRANSNHTRTIKARQYETAKKSISVSCRGNLHPGFGINPFTAMQIEEISKRQSGEGNSMYSKVPWNKGKKLRPRTADEKERTSNALKGVPRPEEVKQKISESHKGKVKTDLHKKHLSESLSGRPRAVGAGKKTGDALRGRTQKLITCPHCGKSGGTTMHRWHFDNCKENSNGT